MKELTIYRTYSNGGTEGRTTQVRNFETIEDAKANAITDLCSDNFRLYEVKMVFDGVITEVETYKGTIVSGMELRRIEMTKELIDELKTKLDRYKADTKMKKRTREILIEQTEASIEMYTEKLAELA